MSGPTQLGDGLTHDPLGFARGVGLGIVEEVHAGVVGGCQAVGGQVSGQLGSEGDPGAERKHAHLQARPTQMSVFHVHADVSLLADPIDQ